MVSSILTMRIFQSILVALIEDPVVSQTKIDEEKAERDLEHRLHGREIFRGGKPDRTPSDLLEQDKKK